MRHSITAPFRRVKRAASEITVQDVHFHLDAKGGAFVCDHHRCDSPRLTEHELGFGR